MRPDRVFLDANTLISGVVFTGNERNILLLAIQGKLTLILADAVLDETERIVDQKFTYAWRRYEAAIAMLHAEIVPYPSAELVAQALAIIRDPKDAPILASALIARPDYVISGDKHFHTDAVKAVVPVIRCAEYLQRFHSEE